MKQRIFAINNAGYFLEKGNLIYLVVTAIGQTTLGHTEPELRPISEKPNQEGLLEYEFLVTPPPPNLDPINPATHLETIILPATYIQRKFDSLEHTGWRGIVVYGKTSYKAILSNSAQNNLTAPPTRNSIFTERKLQTIPEDEEPEDELLVSGLFGSNLDSRVTTS